MKRNQTAMTEEPISRDRRHGLNPTARTRASVTQEPLLPVIERKQQANTSGRHLRMLKNEAGKREMNRVRELAEVLLNDSSPSRDPTLEA